MASGYRIVAQTRQRELKTRLMLAAVICAVAMVVAPGWGPVLWYGLVVVTQVLDLAVFTPARRSGPDWRPDRSYRVVTALTSFVATLVYSGIGAYLWFAGGEPGRLFAMLQFAGGLLHVSLHMHQQRSVLLSAALAHSIYLMGLPLHEAWRSGQAVYGVAAIAALLYLAHLVVAVRQAAISTQALHDANDASRAAQARAESASAAKSEFLAVVSHEIRTPMNAVISAANLLKRSRLNRSQGEQVSMLLEAGDVLMGLLNDVLDFSKIEAGKMTLELAPFDPAEKLGALARIWRPRAEAKGVALELVVDGELPSHLSGDALRFQQILFNLLSNAVKFTDEGYIEIRAAWRGGMLDIAVSDSGCGIPADRLRTVFDSFEQAEAGTTRRYGGSGLGLTISRRLAELMDGQLTVTSVEGEGAVFRLSLPLDRADAAAARAPTSIDMAALKGLRVLAAEDHPVNRRILSLLLEPYGCSLALVENGAEAVELAQIEAFDAVLMDMQMPVMDGLEASRRIRAGGPNAGTPIIALTANAMDVHRQAWAEVGATGFVSKPIDPEALMAALAAAAAEAGSVDQSRSASDVRQAASA